MYTERTVDGMGNYCTKERDCLCHPGSFDSAQDKLHAARRVVEGSRRGFTLMELMVYIAIVGIVVLVAGQAYSSSAKSRIRTESMLKASEAAENVASIFKTDVSQTGAKSSLETRASDGSDDTFGDVKPEVYMDPNNATSPDFSSFDVTTAGDFSDLKVRRVRYDDAGHYQGVEEIRWYVEEDTLKRSCWTVVGTPDADNCNAASKDDAAVTEMATGVKQFIVLPAIPSTSEGNIQMFPSPSGSGSFKLVSRVGVANMLPVIPGDPGTSVTLKGFQTNYDEDNEGIPSVKKLHEVYVFEHSDAPGNWKTLCENSANHFTFVPGEEYEISFGVGVPADETANAKMFVPGKDHMAVGLRNADGDRFERVPDFLFYPPSISEANGVKRAMRFSVPVEVEDACIAFTFSFFSPLAADGIITISDFRLAKVAASAYNFDPTTTSVAVADKKNVKALQLRLNFAENGESGSVTLVVPTPSNGPTD